MLLYIYVFVNILCFSYQNVRSAFFCDNFLREIYLVDESSHTEKSIATGWEGSWSDPYYFENLQAEPGDLIKLKCYNVDGWSYGAGCFLINNICRCYMFDNEIKDYTNLVGPHPGKVYFSTGQECNINVYFLNQFGVVKDYYYQHYIPLDVNGITCKNDFVLTIQNDINYSLKLSDYIDANFNLKNLEISITQNYDFFKLNNNKLNGNNRFKILNEIIFYSKKPTKINIKFKSYGIILEGTKICELNIRVCYERCLDCYDNDPNESNHQCKKCKEGYYFVENTNNCMTKEEMEGTNYYFYEEQKIFVKCYEDCLTCYGRGDGKDMKCISCDNNKYLAEPNNCIDDITNYFYSEEDKIYKRCFITCFSCYSESS